MEQSVRKKTPYYLLCFLLWGTCLFCVPTMIYGQEGTPVTAEFWQQRPPAAEEPFIPAFSMTQALDYLELTSKQWYQTRSCVTCHTNGLAILPLTNSRRTNSGVRADLQDYVTTLSRDISEQRSDRVSTEGLMASVAFLLLSGEQPLDLEPELKVAIEEIWRRQSEAGDWPSWLQCNWPPFEVDSHFGATLWWAALGHLPDSLATLPSNQQGQQRLRDYLLGTTPETLHQRGMMLWADIEQPGLLTKPQRQETIDRLLELQNKDGGWNVIRLGLTADQVATTGRWARTDGTPQERDASDGYGTGYVLWILLQAGLEGRHPAIQDGIAWLQRHQRVSGRWYVRSPRRDGRHYLSNAATSFAVLALQSHHRAVTPKTVPAQIQNEPPAPVIPKR